MSRMSTLVWNPDTTAEQKELVQKFTPLLHITRGDRMEVINEIVPTIDGEEVNLYVIVHTGNVLGFLADLRDIGFYM